MTDTVAIETPPTLSDLEAVAESHLSAALSHMQEFIRVVLDIQDSGLWRNTGYATWEDYFEARFHHAYIRTWSTFRGLKRVVPLQIAAQAEYEGVDIKPSHAREALRGLDTSDPKTQDIAIQRLGRAIHRASQRNEPLQARHIKQLNDSDAEIAATGAVTLSGASVDIQKAEEAGIDAITLSELERMQEATMRRNQAMPTTIIKGAFVGSIRNKDTGELFTEEMIVGVIVRSAA